MRPIANTCITSAKLLTCAPLAILIAFGTGIDDRAHFNAQIGQREVIAFGEAGAEAQFDFECLLAGGRAENQVEFRAGHRTIEGRLDGGVVNAADELLDDETLP